MLKNFKLLPLNLINQAEILQQIRSNVLREEPTLNSKVTSEGFTEFDQIQLEEVNLNFQYWRTVHYELIILLAL